MLLSIAIQHHPSRDHLLGGLASLRAEVVTDPDPDGPRSAIRTYLECLRDLDSSHRLVLQDDALPCSDFRRRAEAAISERPTTLVAFFVPGTGLHGRWVRDAAKDGRSWVQLATSVLWMPTVALSWPRELAEEFVPFAEQLIASRAGRKMGTVGDDPIVGAFCRKFKAPVWATVPCLVEHPDIVPSLVKRRSYDGRNPARKAAVFSDD